jgi:hypothetical protein
MRRFTLTTFIVGITLVALSACGGGGSSTTTATTTTGKFIDSQVKGLDYNCSSGLSGVTNDAGEFTCNVGDSVSFSISGIAS